MEGQSHGKADQSISMHMKKHVKKFLTLMQQTQLTVRPPVYYSMNTSTSHSPHHNQGGLGSVTPASSPYSIDWRLIASTDTQRWLRWLPVRFPLLSSVLSLRRSAPSSAGKKPFPRHHAHAGG